MSYDYLQSDLSDLDDEVVTAKAVTAKAVSTTGTSVKKERQWCYPPDHPVRANISAANKGRVYSPEIRAQMLIRAQDPVRRAKLSAAQKGKKLSEEQLHKMRMFWQSAAYKDALMEGLNNLHKATWTVVATGMSYTGTARQVAEQVGVSVHTINKWKQTGKIIRVKD